MIRGVNLRTGAWLALAGAGAALDQLSKTAIDQMLPLGQVIAVTGFFNVVHVLNPGAAFSFLAAASGWQQWFFGFIALAVSIFLVALILRRPPANEALAYALILGGAMGNLIDRVARCAVVDWLDFHWQGMHWPAFNVADICIVVGATAMVPASIRSSSPLSRTP